MKKKKDKTRQDKYMKRAAIVECLEEVREKRRLTHVEMRGESRGEKTI